MAPETSSCGAYNPEAAPGSRSGNDRDPGANPTLARRSDYAPATTSGKYRTPIARREVSQSPSESRAPSRSGSMKRGWWKPSEGTRILNHKKLRRPFFGEPARSRTENQQIKSLWESQVTSSPVVTFRTNSRLSNPSRDVRSGKIATLPHGVDGYRKPVSTCTSRSPSSGPSSLRCRNLNDAKQLGLRSRPKRLDYQ